MEVNDWGLNTVYQASLDFDFKTPLVLIFMDQTTYRLEFKSGKYSETGLLNFGENFTLPWLLDPSKPFPN